MSRKGKQPIPVPKGVEVQISGKEVKVKGPKGHLTQTLHPSVDAKLEDGQIVVILTSKNPSDSQYHGLFRTLISNMVEGTTKGFETKLEMIGVGYRAAVQGNHLDVQVGFSHPTKLDIPQGIKINIEKGTLIMVTGIDKHEVGQFAAKLRAVRPPEPYQGKGIRYVGEYVRKKAGKAAAKK